MDHFLQWYNHQRKHSGLKFIPRSARRIRDVGARSG